MKASASSVRTLVARGTGRWSTRCPRCGARFSLGVTCRKCRWAPRLGAARWIALVSDRGSFRPLGAPRIVDPLGFVDDLPYLDHLARARAASGQHESVVAGTARIDEQEVVLVVFEFEFLGGSLGVAAGETIVAAFAAAAERHVPVVMAVASSGARMQEGLAALFQMAATSAAVLRFRRSGLAFVAVLADPTTGAPYASCANLADVVVAEAGALIGFAGPRVVAAVTGRVREGRRAEQLIEAGVVDAVVPRDRLREELAALLRLLRPRAPRPARPQPPIADPAPTPPGDRWELLESLRRPEWPTGREWLRLLARRQLELRGDRAGTDDRALVAAVAEVGDVRALVLAQDRHAGLVSAAGYRKAVRAVRIASRLGLPIVSLVDTPGAAVGPEADDDGVAHWIAECFAALLEAPVPVVSLTVGQGSSGGALALAVADRMYMLERSVFSVIAPEGAAAILSRSPRPPSEWAERLRVTAADAFALGLVDAVVPIEERGRRARAARVRRVRELLTEALAELSAVPSDELVDARLRRYAETGRLFERLPEAGEPQRSIARAFAP